MVHNATVGVVIRVREQGSDLYLTVLSPQRGRFTLLAKGAKSLKNKDGQMAVSQQFAHCDFEHYRRGDMEILKGGVILTAFHELSRHEDRLHLSYYLCQVTEELTDAGEESETMYRLILNALYDIDRGLHSHALVKAAFELRAAAENGYSPGLSGCGRCGSSSGDCLYLDVSGGTLLCPDCLSKRPRTGVEPPDGGSLCRLTSASLAAMRYVLSAPLSRLFSFELNTEEDRELLSRAAQAYLLYHLGRSFSTLESYLSLGDTDSLALEIKKKMKQKQSSHEDAIT